MNDNTRIVALNARFTGTQQPTGTQIASFHLFDAILRSERQVRAVVFADRRFAGVEAWASLAGTEIVDIPFGSWKRSVAQIWEQVSLPRAARRRGCRLIHHPMTTGSLLKLGLASIVTVHDLNFYHHGEWISRAFRWWLCRVIVPVIKRADRVVAISDYVLDDVRRTLHISESRSLRIYNGLRSLSTELVRSETAAEIPNILGVNLWQPHKNLPRLINAFKRVKQVHPNLELHLAGRPQGTFRSQPELAAMIEQPGVKVLGYLSEKGLARAYANASVVCYPSLAEGFGLPLLEAMSAGAPVVTSNCSCLPEIAGGAAILVDPLSEEGIAAGILEALAETPAARARRISLGRKVARSFTWENAAARYLQLYNELL